MLAPESNNYVFHEMLNSAINITTDAMREKQREIIERVVDSYYLKEKEKVA